MVLPRKRRRWFWLLLLPALLLASLFVLRYLLQPDRMSDFLLQQASQATGLSLTLGEPADIGLWPDLHLELGSLTATAPGAITPLLQVERVDVVLPWSALRADTIQLRSLRLQSPVLDTEALSQWLQSRDPTGPPAPLQLPRIDAALAITSGRIQGAQWALAGLDLSLPFLRVGAPVNLRASGRIEAGARDAIPFALEMVATPAQDGGGLRLDALSLALRSAWASPPWLQVEGQVALPSIDALQLDLVATLPEWPADWPALPLPTTADVDEVGIDIDYRGSTTLQGNLVLQLVRGEDGLRGELRIGDLLAWLEDASATPLPPLTGEVSSDRIDAGGIELHGVRLRIDESPQTSGDDGR